MSIYREYREHKQIQNCGLIIIGYQGIGKSSYASSRNKTIDLESSNFKVDGERDDNWQVVYCQIAVSLAKQGYIVFTSSHQVVVEEFMKYGNRDDSYIIVIVSPYHSLDVEWVEKLRQRWLADTKNEKNRIAYKDAEENFQNEIYWLASQNEFPYIPIKSMDYLFSSIVEGLCCIYGIDRYCRSKIHRRRDYDENEDCYELIFMPKTGKFKKRPYECEFYKVLAPDKSCLFCKHCCDVFYDYTNGPYMFFCDTDGDTNQGAFANCNKFEEEFDTWHVKDY